MRENKRHGTRAKIPFWVRDVKPTHQARTRSTYSWLPTWPWADALYLLPGQLPYRVLNALMCFLKGAPLGTADTLVGVLTQIHGGEGKQKIKVTISFALYLLFVSALKKKGKVKMMTS